MTMGYLIMNNAGTKAVTSVAPTASRTGQGRSLRLLGLLTLCGLAAHAAVEQDQPVPPADPAPAASKVRSAEDGWVDISAFLAETYGFVPLVMPITEPAVGYGASGG
jgi:hypothetical protein